ncbi:MAG TPA: response regulator, partial [Aggregatilineales bacterium]|nr:response regulator [Aggregatilineales bacterium]
MHEPPIILITDDEEDTASLLTRICTRAGFDTRVASDGFKSLELAESISPDLILLDIQMPGLTGFEVVEQLRQKPKTAQIPIIVITAAATKPEDAVRGIEIGADDYILKPFNYHELVARMRAKLKARELEERLKKRTGELELLVRLGEDLSRSQEIQLLAENLLNFLNRELEAEISVLCTEAREDHPAIEVMLQNGTLSRIENQINRDYFHQSVADANGHILNAERLKGYFQRESIQSGIFVPVTHDDMRIGILAIGHSNSTRYGTDELRVMGSVSRQAALAIRNAQLYESLRIYADELETRVEERTEELQKAQKQLMRSEKLASLGRLSGEIAHEINNPLQPIMTCLEGVIEDVESKSAIDIEDLQMAMSEVTRLKRTVTRLLDFARPDSSGVVKVNINELAHEVLALIHKKLYNTHIKLVTDMKDVPEIQANPDQIKQVLLNIAINAVDAMSGQQESIVQIRLVHEPKQDYVAISICDNGEGIPPER